MALFVEFHLIQNFAPSNLNRDDTGAPKDALFGGHRRARVSSQCFKRAIRLSARDHAAIPPEFQGVRTKKLLQMIEERLGTMGRSEAQSRIEAALNAAGLKLKDGKTEYLLFLGMKEIDGFAQLVNDYWDELVPTVAANGEKKSKKEAKASAPAEVAKKARAFSTGARRWTWRSSAACSPICPR